MTKKEIIEDFDKNFKLREGLYPEYLIKTMNDFMDEIKAKIVFYLDNYKK